MPYFGVTPAAEFTSKDLDGKELILDADADTTITADTDDQIDIRIAGADDFQFTANTFTAQSGSTIAAQALTATSLTGLTTPLTVAQGGSGAATHTANGVLLGAGTGAMTTAAPSTSGNVLTSNGTVWASAAPGGGSLILLDTQTASNSSSLDFTTGIDATYSAYLFVLDIILSADSGADMWVRISDDGGSSFEAGSTDYDYVITKREANGNNFVGHGASEGAAQILISASQNNSTGHMGGTMWLFSPASSATFPVFKSDTVYMNTDSPAMLRQDDSIGVYNAATAAVDGIRFLYSTGNITSGIIRLYGLAIT